jgi:uncharacterized protein YdcH (DUF465 family)
MADKAGAAPTTKGAAAAPPSFPADPDKPHLSADQVKEAHYRRLMAEHRNIDAQIAELDGLKKAKNKLRTACRNKLKGDLQIFLSNVDNVLGDEGKSRGLPVARTGEQLDLLNRMPTTERERLEWENDGYNAGCIDKACEVPAGCPPIFHQDWMKKWHDGQERRAWAFAAEKNTAIDPDKKGTLAPAPVDHSTPQEDDETCATCKGDGTGLAADVSLCPDCMAEYEPADLVH